MPDSVEVVLCGAGDASVSACGSLRVTADDVDLQRLRSLEAYVRDEWGSAVFDLFATPPEWDAASGTLAGSEAYLVGTQERYDVVLRAAACDGSRCVTLHACERGGGAAPPAPVAEDAELHGCSYDSSVSSLVGATAAAAAASPPRRWPQQPARQKKTPQHVPKEKKAAEAAPAVHLTLASSEVPPVLRMDTVASAAVVEDTVWVCGGSGSGSGNGNGNAGGGGGPSSAVDIYSEGAAATAQPAASIACAASPTCLAYAPAAGRLGGSRSGGLVWIGHRTGLIEAVDATTHGVVFSDSAAHAAPVTALDCSGALVVSGCAGGLVAAWTTSGQESSAAAATAPAFLASVGSHRAAVSCALATPRVVVTGTEDGLVRVWDPAAFGAAAAGEDDEDAPVGRHDVPAAHRGRVTAAAETDSGCVWTCGDDGTVRCFDVAGFPAQTPRALAVHTRAHAEAATALVALGTRVFAAGLDGDVTVYDAASGLLVGRVAAGRPLRHLHALACRTQWRVQGLSEDENEDACAVLTWVADEGWGSLPQRQRSAASPRLPAAQASPPKECRRCPGLEEEIVLTKGVLSATQQECERRAMAAEAAEDRLAAVERRAEADAAVAAQRLCQAAAEAAEELADARRHGSERAAEQEAAAAAERREAAAAAAALERELEGCRRRLEAAEAAAPPPSEGEAAARRALQRETEARGMHDKAERFFHAEVRRLEAEHAAALLSREQRIVELERAAEAATAETVSLRGQLRVADATAKTLRGRAAAAAEEAAQIDAARRAAAAEARAAAAEGTAR
eukprot:Rhum_TRINITY_DN12744_c0_g1::Rhum_TRINITY_DN12744_c0_g1_i1::g.54102::m.54102